MTCRWDVALKSGFSSPVPGLSKPGSVDRHPRELPAHCAATGVRALRYGWRSTDHLPGRLAGTDPRPAQWEDGLAFHGWRMTRRYRFQRGPKSPPRTGKRSTTPVCRRSRGGSSWVTEPLSDRVLPAWCAAPACPAAQPGRLAIHLIRFRTATRAGVATARRLADG